MKKLFIIFFLLINTAAYLLYLSPWSFRKNAIRIAVAGPMGAERGEAMRRGLELYQEKINRQGGIKGRKLELVYYNDDNDPEKAETIARKITEKNDAMLVLGHYYSSTSASAGNIYKRSEMPAITASATTESVIAGNEWYFRTVPGNVLEARFAANYINKGLNQNRAVLIFSNDDYGISLGENFEKTLKSLGMKMSGKWEWDLGKAPEEQLKTIMQGLEALEDPGILFLATHSAEGVKILTALKDAGKNYPLITSYAFARSFFNEMKPYEKEWSDPGYYSDGVYFVTPFMLSLGGADAFEFGTSFCRKYNKDPGEIEACYYDALHVAAQALRKMEIHGKKQIREDRRKFREILENFYSEENAVRGITGAIYFDKNGGVRRHFAVGMWKKHKTLPAFVQFQQNTAPIDDMLQVVLDGGIILADDIIMSRTRVVYADTEIIRISDISTGRSEFSADFYLHFRYSGDFDDADIEFTNALHPVVPGKPVKEKKERGITERTYLVKAKFRADFDFRPYPFIGWQKLPIHFHHRSQTSDRLIYASDTVFKKTEPDISVSGWDIPGLMFSHDILTKNTGLGNPEYAGSDHKISYSRFNTEISIRKKKAEKFIFLQLLPVILLLLNLFLTYFLPPERLRSRLLIIMLSFGAAAAFHLRYLAVLKVNYLTFMDYSWFSLYILMFLSLFLTVSLHRIHGRGNEKKLKIFNRTAQIVYPSAVLVISGILAFFLLQ